MIPLINVHLDFETRCLLSVKDVGGWVYSRHPSTAVLCAAYAVNDEPTELAMDYNGFRANHYGRLKALALDPEVIFSAHNAFFEQCIWNNIIVPLFDMPYMPPERWRCTAAKAAAFSLPRDLDGIGVALDLLIQKSKEGHKVMMKLSRPRRSRDGVSSFWTPLDAPEDFKTLYSYNMTDVDTERCVDHALPPLNEREQRIWFLDQKINFRGIKLDVAAIQQVIEFIELSVKKMTEEFQELTDHTVDGPIQVARLRNWLAAEGFEMPNLQAATVDKVLKRDDVPWNVYRVLEIRRSLSKISTSKYNAMLNRVDLSDGRLRDILLYCAALTKRWGGRGVQPQNLPRGTVNSDTCIDTILLNDYNWFEACYTDVMAAYSSCVRGMLMADAGCDLIVSDLSAIEARVLPWLAGQESTLDLFRANQDVYCHSAGNTFF